MGSDRSASGLTDKTVLSVPDYQRGYAWDRRYLEEFWEDLEVLPSHARHFTGTVVLLRRPELRVRDDRRVHDDLADIVDGRQPALSPAESSLRMVRPWIWNAVTTDGQALIGAGERNGAQFRLSRYRQALH